VLFLIGNCPEPLPVNMMQSLEQTGRYQVTLLYWERLESEVALPMTRELHPDQCHAVAYRVGHSTSEKVVRRAVVLSRLASRIRELRPDVVHAWNFDMLLAARAAAATVAGTRVVFTLQDTVSWMMRPLSRRLQRRVYSGVDQFLVTSEQFESHLLRRFDLISPQTKVLFVPNAPRAEQFTSFQPRPSDDSLTVGNIGLLRGSEAIRGLATAAIQARERGADVRLLFAGTGVERPLVERLASQHDFVEYAGPYRHAEHIRDLYSRVDLLHSVYDRTYDKQIHLPYRLCEAVACRIPTLVSTGTCLGDLVERHGIGVPITLGDDEELTEVLVRLQQDPSRREEMAQNCAAVQSKFVFESFESSLHQAYRSLWPADEDTA